MTQGGFTTMFELLGLKEVVDGVVGSQELISEIDGNTDEFRAANVVSDDSEGSGIWVAVIDV